MFAVDFAGATVVHSVNPGKTAIALIQIGPATGKPLEFDATARSKLKELGNLPRKGGYLAAGKVAFDWLIEIVEAEVKEKIQAYLAAGATEVWFVSEQGQFRYFGSNGETAASAFGIRPSPPPPVPNP